MQQYNSKLQSDVNTMDESRRRAENEKLTMVENLSNLRGHKKALEDQLASLKVKILHEYPLFGANLFLCLIL